MNSNTNIIQIYIYKIYERKVDTKVEYEYSFAVKIFEDTYILCAYVQYERESDVIYLKIEILNIKFIFRFKRFIENFLVLLKQAKLTFVR